MSECPTGLAPLTRDQRERLEAIIDGGREEVCQVIRALAVTFEGTHPCHCSKLHTPNNPKTATGHVRGCPVDYAVRRDLASAGIV